MVEIPQIVLNNQMECPQLGLGTWQARPGEVEMAVKRAIDMGYRLIDGAMLYGNEKEIGQAVRDKIADGTVKRQDLFIVSKLWNTFHEKKIVVPTCKQSLKNFGLDYLDLYLIHWPVAQKSVGKLDMDFPFKNAVGHDYDFVETWKGMEQCVKAKLTRSIGLSNFNSVQIDRVLAACTIRPVINQIEVHPNLNQKKLIAFCKERNIAVMAYSPFGSPARPWAKADDPVLPFDAPKLLEIANTHNKTSYQVVLRYIIQLGCIPIPKSTKDERLWDNLNVFDFKLSEEEMEIIDTFNCNQRSVPALELKGMPNYPFDGVDS